MLWQSNDTVVIEQVVKEWLYIIKSFWSTKVEQLSDYSEDAQVGPRLVEFLGRPRTHVLSLKGFDGGFDVAVPDRDRARVADDLRS